MPSLAGVLKAEIRRLARKEARAEFATARKAATRHRKDIAELKRQLADQRKQIAALERAGGKTAKQDSTNGASTLPRFSPKWVRGHREKLALSAADYAALVGVSELTIYNWEKGKTTPQAKQLKAWGAVRHLGKREAWKRLDEMGV